MQMPGGHLLAAGLDGGNTTIKSVPSPDQKEALLRECFFLVSKVTVIEPVILSETYIVARKIQIISVISAFATVFAVVWYWITGVPLAVSNGK